MKSLIIVLVILITLNNVQGGSKMAKLLAKASMRSFKKLANKSAKSFIANSLFSGIGSSSHGNTWSHEYFDNKFTSIETTFEMLQSEIDTLSHIIEALEGRSNTKWYNHTIMKSVIFVSIGGLIIAVIWLCMQMRKNIYLKRMKSLINSLASLKQRLKTKLQVSEIHNDVNKLQQDEREYEAGIALVSEN